MLLGGWGGGAGKKGDKTPGAGEEAKVEGWQVSAAARRPRGAPSRDPSERGLPPSSEQGLGTLPLRSAEGAPAPPRRPRRSGPSAAAQGGQRGPAPRRQSGAPPKEHPPPAPYLYLNRSGFVGRQINAIADNTPLPKEEQQVGRRSGLRGLRRKSYGGPYCTGAGHDWSTAGGGILPAGLTCAANTDMWQKDKQRGKLLPPSSQGNWEKR